MRAYVVVVVRHDMQGRCSAPFSVHLRRELGDAADS